MFVVRGNPVGESGLLGPHGELAVDIVDARKGFLQDAELGSALWAEAYPDGDYITNGVGAFCVDGGEFSRLKVKPAMTAQERSAARKWAKQYEAQ